jgi:hypothetical protein
MGGGKAAGGRRDPRVELAAHEGTSIARAAEHSQQAGERLQKGCRRVADAVPTKTLKTMQTKVMHSTACPPH